MKIDLYDILEDEVLSPWEANCSYLRDIIVSTHQECEGNAEKVIAYLAYLAQVRLEKANNLAHELYCETDYVEKTARSILSRKD